MCLARLPLTCGTTLPLVSHVGSKVSVSCPRVELQAASSLFWTSPDRRALTNGRLDEGRDGEQTGTCCEGWSASVPHVQRLPIRIE